MTEARAQGSRLKQVGWLILIWALSVISLGIFAVLFRLIMNMVGMTS